LGVFTALSRRAQTASVLSELLGTPERSLSMLLNANVALGFLVRRGAKYANALEAEVFLVQGKEGYLGDAVLHMSRALYDRWGLLTEVVKQGAPARGLAQAPPLRPETARAFTLAMHGMSSLAGRWLAERLDLSRCHRLLDLGAGSGVISAKLVERFPNLEATLLDLPEVCKVAQQLYRSSPAAKRLTTRPQSYVEPLPRGHDVALLSQILHAESERTCRHLLRRVYEALERPGLIVVIEFALNKQKTGPLFPALFSLNMLINTEEGAAYSGDEITRWLREAGFRKTRARKLPGDRTLFTAEKA
jgi:hypothetical protein